MFNSCERYGKCFVNPLSANVGYIRHDTVVTSDSCNSRHSENYDNILTNFDIFLKTAQKMALALVTLLHVFFIRNLCGGVEAEVPYFF